MTIRTAATLIALILPSAVAPSGGQTFASFDFTQPDQVAQWKPTHDISALTSTAEGMRIVISGDDPYTFGPVRDLPVRRTVWLDMRLKSDQGGMGQVFYFQDGSGPTEENSVRFPVRPGVWEDARLPLPPLWARTRFRIDPPGDHGTCVVQSLSIAARPLLQEPRWPAPEQPRLDAPLYAVASGDLRLIHGPEVGGFRVEVDGQPMAIGYTRPLIGYSLNGHERWLDLAQAGHITTGKDGPTLTATITATDADGAAWHIVQQFGEARRPGEITVRTQVTVDRDRDVAFLPMLTLLPGAGSFGPRKQQALFCGLEYLDSAATEVSSSEADIRGAGARRLVPDTEKITVPLMAVCEGGRFVALAWNAPHSAAEFGAVFDSPDRVLHGGGHLMALVYPGSNGSNHDEGSMLPYAPERLPADHTLTLDASILGGRGDSVVDAVRDYVDHALLPAPPETGLPFYRYAPLAAAGWLDSGIRSGGLYRHAIPGGFMPQPAADAAAWMDWLARQTADARTSARLDAAAREAAGQVLSGDLALSGVGHVRYPLAPLLFGHVEDCARHARREARRLLDMFDADGAVPYRPKPGGTDLGSTHFARDANGLTAQVAAAALDQAAFCGDPGLIAEAIRRLHGLDRFATTAPRGAQTWEVPLHTPDILASANLVRAYTLGYELTGDRALLDSARYWAWTGVPFVYLRDPVDRPIGAYATVPVFGATQWVAPNWMGLPVQWCGIVYAEALYRLLRDDPTGPWKPLADGITASGVQQTWPATGGTRAGLLPDSFALRPQMRNDPAINPATLLSAAQSLYHRPPIYDFRVFRAFAGTASSPVVVHAPGEIEVVGEKRGRLSLRIRAWTNAPYYVLVSGLQSAPRVEVDGKTAPRIAASWSGQEGWLVLRLTGQPSVRITTGAPIPARVTARGRISKAVD